MSNYIAKKITRFTSAVRPFCPGWFLKIYGKIWTHQRRKEYGYRPVADVFNLIYAQNQWGGKPGEYFSGPGSVDPSVSRYIETIKNFIGRNQINNVVDLGCGDFRIGAQIQMPGVKYTGIDIVQNLITHNQREFGTNDISFMCLDVIKDRLPDADLCLIRQVLQHLSNDEIAAIIKNVSKYKFVIVTEHLLPSSIKVIPNKEKPHGPDTRIIDGSGVYLDRPPFNLTIEAVLLDMELRNYSIVRGERLSTILIRNY